MSAASGAWRFVLCDLLGNPISIITQAQDKELRFPLNRPERLSFTVPSNLAEVNWIYTGDGYADPYLTVGTRIIKAYRKHSPGGGNWVLQQNFIVWDLEDSGDGETTRTQVSCYDGLQILRKRLIRYDPVLGVAVTVRYNGATDGSGDLTGMPGDEIAKDLVDKTNTLLTIPTPITTDLGLGATFETAPRQNRSWDQTTILDGLVEMCDTGLLDVWVTPLDRTDGVLWAFHASPQRRTNDPDPETFLTCPDIVISYESAGRSAHEFNRTESMEQVANAINMWGTSTGGYATAKASIASQTKYGIYEAAEVASGIDAPTAIDALATEELQLRKYPRDMVTILPTPLISESPWNDDGTHHYFTGDTIQVHVGTGPMQGDGSNTRLGTVGAQRVYGLTIGVDDDGVESITGLDASPDGIE